MPEPLVPRPPSPPGLRNFVFAPGGPAARNRPLYYLISFLVFLIIALLLERLIETGLDQLSLDNKSLRDALLALRTNVSGVPWRWLLLFFALSYATIALALVLAVKLVHRRNALSLLTDRVHFAWRRAIIGFLIYTAIILGPFLLYVATGASGLKAHFDAGLFVQLLVFSVALLAVQTATEEAIFRGYLTQFTASITDSRAIIVLLPSILFMLAHFGNPEVSNGIEILLFYFGFGVFMSLIVLRERGLELAIAAHFSNNLVNSVIVRTDDSIFQTPTIFILPHAAQHEPLVTAFTGSFAPFLYWIITAFILRKR